LQFSCDLNTCSNVRDINIIIVTTHKKVKTRVV
jgi:hypothetical protein